MAKPRIMVEVVVDTVQSAVAAERGGAGRVELCASLVEGGITPSGGMIAEVRARVDLPVYVMVRPRGGDFLYSESEFAVMRRDIATAQELGADGVVFGLLRPDGTVDAERTTRLVEEARPLDVTFHRAIDVSRDALEAVDDLARIGVDRVLTSGQARTALAGTRTIVRMIERAAGRLVILPGGRISETNAARIVELTGAREIHVRAAQQVRSEMKHRNRQLTFRAQPLASDYVAEYTDAHRIRKIVKAIG